MANEQILYIMYFFLLMLHTENIYSSEWITFIIDILNGCGLSNVWLDQEYMNAEYIKRRVQLTLGTNVFNIGNKASLIATNANFKELLRKSLK